MKKQTVIINLFGAPGTGKSTIMAELFAKLKWKMVDCEMAPEVAKKYVWEKKLDILKDQNFVFEEQVKEITRTIGKTDVVVTDSPMLLSILYAKVNNFNYDEGDFTKKVLEKHYENPNFNVLLKRTKPYNPNGRLQTEEGSNELYFELKNLLDENKILYFELEAKENTTSNEIIEAINKLI